MIYVGKEIRQTTQEKDMYIIPFTINKYDLPDTNLLQEVKDVIEAVENLKIKLRDKYKTRKVEIEPLKINLVVKK